MTNQKELEQLPLLAAVDVEGAKAGSGSSSKPTVEDDSASTIAYLSVLYGLNDGIVKGFTQDGKLDADSLKKCVYLDGTAIMAADGTIQHDVEVAFREGTIDQTAIEGMPSVTVESVIGVTVRSGTPVARTFVRPEVSAYDVRISISRLMQNDDEGNSRKGKVEFAIDVATDSGSYAEYGRYSLNEKISQGFQRTYTVNVPKGNSRSIRVRKLTTDGDNTFIFNDIVLEAITEIVEVKLRYPHTTLLWLKYDARAFSSAPKLEVLLYGKSDIRIPMNYDPDTRKYATTGVGTTNGVWNGQFKLGYTDNPVWHWYDIATSTRYGIGNRITDDIPNKFSLYSMAQYCDELVSDGKGGFEPRFTSNNMYLQSREDAYKVLKDMASVFRAKTLWDGQHLTPKMDVPRDAMLVFSRANCANIAYSSVSDAAQHNIIAVQYYDIDNMYASRYAYARSIENIQRRGRVEQADVTALGCTSEGQAQRMADYLLQCEMLENEIVTFTTGLDGIRPMIGDVFMFADDLISGKATSGRVVSVDGNKVTLDRELNPTLDLEGTFVVNTTESLASTRKITAISADKRTVTLESAITVTDITELVWAVKSKNVGLREFSVDDISYDAEAHSFNITGLLFKREKFTSSDNAANIVNPPYTIIDPEMPREPKTVTATYNSVVRQGINVSNIDVAWSQVTTAARYELEMRRDGGEWRKLGVTQSLTYEVENAYAGTYEFRVRSFDIRNKASRYTQSSPLVVAGKTLPPPVLDAFTVEGGLFSLNAKWSFPQGTEDTLSTRVKVTYSDPSTANTVVYTYDVAYPTNTLTLQNQTSGVQAWMQAAVVDRYGNEGEYTGWATAKVSNDPDAVLDLLQGEIGKEYLTDALAEEIGKSEAALSAANNAAAAANTANLAANNAATAASNAKTAADAAKTSADSAVKSAATAKTTADKAVSSADAAKADAAAAKKHATDIVAELTKDVDTRFDEVADGFVTVRDEQGALTKRLDITDNGITEYKKTVNDQFIAYNDAFTSYSSKVDGSLATLTKSTSTLTTTTEAHTKALDTYTAKTDTMASNLATNYFTRTQTNEAVAAAITNLKLSTTYATVSAMSTLSGRVDKTETGISTLSSDLLTLKTNVETNYSTLTNNYYTKTAADTATAGKVSEAVARLGDQSKKATLTFTESALKTLIKGNTAAPITISSDSTAKVGSVGSLGQASGDSELMYMLPPEEAILIDPDKLYVLRYRFKRVSGAGGVYLGINCINAERTRCITTANGEASLTSFSASHYALSNVTPTLGEWVTGEYYFKGRSTGSASGAGTKENPRKVAAKVAYGRPMFWANYRVSDSVIMCDYVEIECLDVDVSTLATASALAATKAEIVKDYEGKITATANDILNLNTALGNVKTDLTTNYYTKTQADKSQAEATTALKSRIDGISKGGTNLINRWAIRTGFLTANTGAISSGGGGEPTATTILGTDETYYPCKAGEIYCFTKHEETTLPTSEWSRIVWYDTDKALLAYHTPYTSSTKVGSTVRVTAPANAVYYRYTLLNPRDRIKMELGSATEWTALDEAAWTESNASRKGTMTADAVAVMRTELDEVDGRFEAVATDILNLNTGVSNTNANLTNNYLTKSATNEAISKASTVLSTRLDNLSIGGENLLKTTDWQTTADVVFTVWGNDLRRNTYAFNRVGGQTAGLRLDAAAGTGAYGFSQLSSGELSSVIAGKEYTLSFVGQGTFSSLNYCYLLYADSGVDNQPIGSIPFGSGGNTRRSITFKAATTSDKVRVLIAANRTWTATDWFSVAEVKLEEGNVATAWSANSAAGLKAVNNALATAVKETNASIATVNGAVEAHTNDLVSLKGSVGDMQTDLTNNYYTKTTADEAVSGKVSSAVASLSLSNKKATLVFTNTTLPNLVTTAPATPVALSTEATAKAGSIVTIGTGTGDAEAIYSLRPEDAILIDPDKLYVIRYRYKRISGAGGVYVGLSAMNEARTLNISSGNVTTALTNFSSSHYCVSNGKPAYDTWVTGEYYIKGRVESGSATGAGTKANPRKLAERAVYARPIFWSSYQTKDTVTVCDYVEIECLDVDTDTFATAAALSQTNVDVSKVNGRVDATVTDISTLNTSVGNVKTDLTNNYLTKANTEKAITSASNVINTRIDGISKGGTNLLNRWALRVGFLATGTGAISSGGGGEPTDKTTFATDETYYPCKAGEVYCITKHEATTTPTGEWSRVVWYDSSKTYLAYHTPYYSNTAVGSVGKITAPANAAYFRYTLLNPRDRVKLELGVGTEWTAEDEAAWSEPNVSKRTTLLATYVDDVKVTADNAAAGLATEIEKTNKLAASLEAAVPNVLINPVPLNNGVAALSTGTIVDLAAEGIGVGFATKVAVAVSTNVYPMHRILTTLQAGGLNYLAVTEGDQYLIEVDVYSTIARNFRITADMRNDANVTQSTLTAVSYNSAPANATIAANTWTTYMGVITIPAGVTKADFVNRIASSATGASSVYIRNASVKKLSASEKLNSEILTYAKTKVDDVDGRLSTTALQTTNLEAKYNAQKIGGTNLLKGTKSGGFIKYGTTSASSVEETTSTAFKTSIYRFERVTASTGIGITTTSANKAGTLSKGKEYTLSFYARGTASINYVYTMGSSSTGANTNIGAPTTDGGLSSTDFKKFTRTFTATFDAIDKVGILVGTINGTTVGEWLEVAEVMIQEGNTPTDWQASYLDVPVVDLSDYAKAGAVSSLEARVDTAEGKITTQATSLDKLTTTSGQHTASLETQGKVVDGLSASWTLKADVNGYVAGMGTYNNGTTSEIVFRADKIAFANPTGTGKMYGFVYQSSAVTLPNGTVIPAGLKVNAATIGAIDAKNINAANLSVISGDLGTIKVKSANIDNLAVNTIHIANNALTNSMSINASVSLDQSQFTAVGTELTHSFSVNFPSLSTVSINSKCILFLQTDLKSIMRYAYVDNDRTLSGTPFPSMAGNLLTLSVKLGDVVLYTVDGFEFYGGLGEYTEAYTPNIEGGASTTYTKRAMPYSAAQVSSLGSIMLPFTKPSTTDTTLVFTITAKAAAKSGEYGRKLFKSTATTAALYLVEFKK